MKFLTIGCFDFIERTENKGISRTKKQLVQKGTLRLCVLLLFLAPFFINIVKAQH